MAGETEPSSSPAGPCAAPPDEQAGSRTPRKLFTSKAMSQLRSNLRATAGTPLFGPPKLGGQPSLLPKLTESLRLALKPKQEAARARPAQRPRAPSLKVPAVAASALAVVPEDSLPEAQAVPRPHHSLANLELLRTLGTGTFGRVRLVRCRATGRYLALKALKKAQILSLRQERSVYKEKQILASLQHPFIVRMLAVFSDQKRVYLLMEYVPGGELFKRLREAPGRRLGLAEARFYAAGVALALDYLHSRGVLYRDLKPENLLLDAAGYIKLTDFGFARELPENCKSFTVCGTTDYMAPETIRGIGSGYSADWWAFGVLIFEMLCGYAPFQGATTAQVYKRILAGTYVCPAGVDPCAQDLIRGLLTREPAARLGSAACGGAQRIFAHPFFEGLPWEGLLQGRLPAPSVPALGAPGDARHFNRYTESVDEGDGAGGAGPGPGGAAGEDAFSDFGVTRLITEDAVRCFQRRMSRISNG